MMTLTGWELGNHGGLRSQDAPRTLLTVKDKTHAARRLLLRPWTADEVIDNIVKTMVTDKHSITQRIRNSPDLTSIFEECVRAMGDNPIADSGAPNLSNALHRFDSVLRPMSRGVLLLDGLIGSAMKIMWLRKGQVEGQDMEDFLLYVAGEIGLERLLVFGMITDAAEALMDFLRFFDTESYDAALVRNRVQQLAKTLHWAFTEAKVVSTEGSYTHRMLMLLAKSRTVVIKGQVYVIGSPGGVPRSVIDKALARLNSFVVLSIAALRAEFPSWEVMQNFSAFDLSHADRSRNLECLHRLAVTFELDKSRLVSSFDLVLPKAHALKQQHPSQSNFDCWKNAFEQHGKPKTLCAALARYAACCGCTTSGVEQLHSLQDWLWPKRRKKLGEGRSNDEMKIVVDAAEYDRESIITVAREIWMRIYGKPRVHKVKRKDSGKEKPKVKGKTLANWTRNYKEKISREAANRPEQSLASFQRKAALQVADTWSDAKTIEIDHQWAVRKEHLLQGVTDGTLLEADATEQDAEVAQARVEHIRELRSKRKRVAARTEWQLREKTRDEKALPVGATVYIEPGIMTGQQMDAAQRLVVAKMMQFTNDPVSALVYVTTAMDKPNAETAWAVMLTGGILCDSAYFLKDGQQGSAIMYKAAVAGGMRSLWLSAKFRQQRPTTCDVISRSMRSGASRWRMVDNRGFADAVAVNDARPARQKRNLEQVGIVLDDEERAVLAMPMYIFTEETFRKKFTVMADSHTAL